MSSISWRNSTPIWIADEYVVEMHRALVTRFGGGHGLRSEDLLAAALGSPRQRFSLVPDSTIFDLAAAYAVGLVLNHAFVDGNKRTAYAVCATFLHLNDRRLEVAADAAKVMMVRLATRAVSFTAFSSWLRETSKRIVTSPGVQEVWQHRADGTMYRVLLLGRMEQTPGEWIDSVTFEPNSIEDALTIGSRGPFTRARAKFLARFQRITATLASRP